ncbi:splicing factor 45-like [Lineus longissimus]|uniref:splicing factor 45-like n=1 Tax=Lineus longissimus TaxID=88925 RepID=UPI002B4DBD19
MSLYDDVDTDVSSGNNAKSDISGWSSSFKLLQSQLQAKKVINAKQRESKKRQGTTLAPVIDLKRSTAGDDLHFNMITGKLDRMAPVASPFIAVEPTAFSGVVDEYNPLYPNDYEELVKKRRDQKAKEREEERKKEQDDRDRRRRDRYRDDDSPPKRSYGSRELAPRDPDERKPKRREDDDDEYDRPRRKAQGGAAIAPPTMLIEEDMAASVEVATGINLNAVPPPGPFSVKPEPEEEKPLPGASMGLAGSVASKIMAKYGYKEGQGLGKKEQGMSTALLVEKTSKRGGKIIHEKDIPKFEPPKAEVPTNTNLLKNPSKVILLLNMVGPGEVDADLEPETAEECAKYGKVIRCVIFEIPGAEDTEAVRIFLEFERVESAIKAIVDLNGRFFGGRTVKACFYNLDKFRRFDLGDSP